MCPNVTIICLVRLTLKRRKSLQKVTEAIQEMFQNAAWHKTTCRFCTLVFGLNKQGIMC